MSKNFENASARDRLDAAELKFDDLTQGGRDLVDQSGTRYRFADGEEVTGVKAAADHAEQIVRRTAEQIRRNTP